MAEVSAMREIIEKQPGALAVPDIIAIVVGPGSVIVGGDVILDDDLDVPPVEASIVMAAAALRQAWPAVTYVYLNPVARPRPRRGIAVRPGR